MPDQKPRETAMIQPNVRTAVLSRPQPRVVVLPEKPEKK